MGMTTLEKIRKHCEGEFIPTEYQNLETGEFRYVSNANEVKPNELPFFGSVGGDEHSALEPGYRPLRLIRIEDGEVLIRAICDFEDSKQNEMLLADSLEGPWKISLDGSSEVFSLLCEADRALIDSRLANL